MITGIVYATERRVNKIIETLKDQKKKYGLDTLSSTKIQSLSGMNYHTCEEVLREMKEQGKIELVEENGKKRYWRLI